MQAQLAHLAKDQSYPIQQLPVIADEAESQAKVMKTQSAGSVSWLSGRCQAMLPAGVTGKTAGSIENSPAAVIAWRTQQRLPLEKYAANTQVQHTARLTAHLAQLERA
jgi:hypothetical protein